jgi:serine/threonine protein kinase
MNDRPATYPSLSFPFDNHSHDEQRFLSKTCITSSKSCTRIIERDMTERATKDDFELLDQLGKGAYGTVFKALDKRTGKIVAVKIVALQSDWLPLLKEVNMIISLNHPSIVNYYCWFFNEGCLWLVMEFCDGGSLSDVMSTLKRPLDETELSAVLQGVLRSLDYVHSLNRVHRDIKSGNLLVTSEGVVKLCDFGVSAQLDDALSRTGTRIGSPYWMAPEVITSQGHNTKADIWSFGITALELFNGVPPLWDIQPMTALLAVPKNPPPAAPDSASDRFKTFIQKTLVKDPEQRPSASELLEDEFITQTSDRAAAEILRGLVNRFIAAKAAPSEDEVEVEEEDEEDEGESFTDLGDDLQSTCATILFNDGGGDGTMIVEAQRGPGLAEWKPDFADAKPPPPKIIQARNRCFGNFSVPDLELMLAGVKTLAEQELEKGAVSAVIIRATYEEGRRAIVAELKRKKKDVPNDYQTLDK